GDAELVRILINALRHPRMELVVPDKFDKWSALLAEAHYLGLKQIEQRIQQNAPQPNMITLAYHGALPLGIQAFATDVNFRKISRILVSGKVTVCRQVFGESLNESRDVAMESVGRYTGRFFLKHTSLERALDALTSNGFKFTSANSHSPSGAVETICTDEQCYIHYTQFIFIRKPSLAI
uniref:KCTD8/12/16 H1 domain-containing protein n=1 Tax=Parascaris univalens TaxID=6257 RepID=A0A915AL51_PARUN